MWAGTQKTRAILAAVVGLTLTATGALAASSVVSTLARDHTAVGGPNANHGGAVSLVARGTHGPTATHGKSRAGAHKPTH